MYVNVSFIRHLMLGEERHEAVWRRNLRNSGLFDTTAIGIFLLDFRLRLTGHGKIRPMSGRKGSVDDGRVAERDRHSFPDRRSVAGANSPQP